MEPRAELASYERFLVANIKGEEAKYLFSKQGLWDQAYDSAAWKAMYEAGKVQHYQAVKSKAGRNLVAYGMLCALCVGLLITHLRWARRLTT